MAKHCFSDRDNSVAIFIHWTRTANHGKPFRATLSTIPAGLYVNISFPKNAHQNSVTFPCLGTRSPPYTRALNGTSMIGPEYQCLNATLCLSLPRHQFSSTKYESNLRENEGKKENKQTNKQGLMYAISYLHFGSLNSR